MRKKWTIAEISEFTREYNYILLSDNYKTQKDKLDMICPNGHECSISFDNFKKNKRCKTCRLEEASERYRHSPEFIASEYAKYGYEVIQGLDEYRNLKSPLVVKCNCGHTYNTYYGVYLTGSKCPYCFGKPIIEYEYVKNKFDEYGYDLISDIYVNSDTDLYYMCRKHPDTVKKVTWNNFTQGRACAECGKDKTAKARRLNIEEVRRRFEENNKILLEEEYINNTTIMAYKCKRHPDEIQYSTLGLIESNKYTCKQCFEENTQGENRYNWNGLTPISEYLRKKITDWKKESAANCQYKCVITGDSFDHIHHLYSFQDIVNEAFIETGLEIKKEIGDYSQLELNKLTKRFLEIHSEKPLGVCLRKDIHVDFHRIYGKKNNRPEQFYQYLEKSTLNVFIKLNYKRWIT